MRTLLVLRHAKSDRSDPCLPDHDRPLAPHGEADAPRIGAALAALAVMPDCIITSTAVRARDTAHLVVAAFADNYNGRIDERDTVYAADVPALLTVLRACDDAHETVLLVGHNPGLEDLISVLVGGGEMHPVTRLPTAALACLSLDIAHWAAIDAASGSLAWLLTPRILASLAR